MHVRRAGYYSENFKVLDLSSFDTSKVTDMNCMLSEMSYVEEIKFGTGFDTGAVTNMEFMFAYDYALKTLDLTGFNTQNVEDMSRMFDCCENLTSLDISSFDTSNVTDFYCFLDCTYLLSDLKINPLTFTTAKAENLGYMFSDCDALTEDDLAFVKDFDLSSCTSILGMFCGSEAIEELDLTSWDVSNVESFSSLFSGCKNLRSVDMSGWDTSALLNLSNMFNNCPKLEELDLSSISTAGVRYFDSMFSGCTGLESLDLSSFDTSNATSMYNMFSGCTGLESLDLSSFDVSGLTNMQYIFRNCSALTELDLSGWAPVSVTQITDAFSGCTSLKTIYASSAWKLNALSSDAVMFTGDTALVGGNGTAFDASKADSSMARIDKAAAPGYFTLVRDPNTLEYRSVSTMFGGAASDSADAYEQWIDNGDGTWTYRFKIMDEDNLYYGWEESAPGYTWTVDETSPAAIDYKAGDRDKGFEVVNTKRSDMTTGMLQISKRVDGALAYGDTDRYFHFEVSIPGLADGSYGDLIFADGKARLQLKGGEIALAEDIPAGLGYTVAEIGADGFDVTSAGESGSIESGKLAKAAFTNTRPDLTGSLAIEKKLVSGSSDQSFVIAVKLTGPQIGGVQVFGDYVFKDGYAKLSVNAGERVLLSGIPENTSYQTAENAAAGFILESAENASGAITKGKTAEVVYTNKKQEQITGGFTLEKVMVGSAASDSFEFIAAFEGLIPGAGYSFSDGTSFTAGAAGTATAVLHLCGGESVSIEGLPVGAFYTIVEKASDYRASYTISDAGDLGLISRAQGANTAIGADLSTEKEEVNKGESITVTFENRTQLFRAAFAKEALPGEFLDGAVLQIWSGSSLIYEWTSSSDAMEVLELAAGSYRLVEKTSPEGYKKADDIEFEISNEGEILIGGAGADFVTMTDKPLSVEIRKLNQDGETVTGASIAVYRGEDVSPEGEISDSAVPVHTFISKESPEKLTGRLAAGREYVLVELASPAGYGISEPVRFTVSGNDDTTKVSMTDPRAFYVPFGKYDEAGSFLAGASLQILKAGSRDVVREWTSADRESSFGLAAGDYIFHEAATPDDSLYMLAEDIAFSVGADGKILCGGEEITGLSMTDALIPLLSASVEIKAQKIVNGKPAQGSGYSFVLKKDGAEIQRVSNTDIDISFAKITYTAPGTYEYTVSEIPGSDTGTVYDASVYDVKVVVSEGFELSMEITRGGEPVNGMPVFSNITRPDPKPPVEPGDPEETYTLTYHVAGDDRYGVPSDSRTPSAVDGIELGGSVDPLAGGPVTRWTTSDGTPDGIPGSWSFSEHWTLKSSDPGAADITSDKITGIRSDKDVYGKWVFTPDAQPGPGGENLPGTDPDPGTVPDPGTTPDPGAEPDPGDTGLGGPDGPGSGHGTEGDDIGEETPEDPWMPRTGDSDITLYTWLMIVSLACMLWLKRLSRG